MRILGSTILALLTLTVGCDDRPLPLGDGTLMAADNQAAVTLEATEEKSDASPARVTAISTDPQVAIVTETLQLSCWCDNPENRTRSLLLDVTQSCATPKRKGCRYEVELKTRLPGDATVELRAGDVVLGRQAVRVREVARVGIRFDPAGPRQTRKGRTLVYLGPHELAVEPRPEDAEGRLLLHRVHDFESSNPEVVAIDTSLGPNPAPVPRALGSATLTARVGPVSASLEIDVVAP